MDKKYKKCSKCLQIKHSDFFYKKTDKVSSKAECKECHNKGIRKYSKTSKGKLRHRKARLKYEYGLTEEVYRELLDKTNGCCPICKKSIDWSKGIIAVDHCHSTGEVRGLLCDMCNKMIGCAYDDPEILRNAALYLEPRGV